MKFDASLKPQDKKTIGIVLYIAVVALFGWYMIRPTALKIGELDDKVKSAEATKQEYKMKSMQLSTAEVLYDKAVTDILDSTKNFYDVMDNSKIEKMGTTYILGKGLTPINFTVDIRDGSFVEEEPYTFADIKTVQPVETTEETGTTATTSTTGNVKGAMTALDVKSLQAYYSGAIAGVTSTTASQVQCAKISIVVQGPQNKCQAMIDDITKKPSIRVTGFSWSDAKEVWSEDDKGNKTLMNPDYKELKMDLHFYMTEKPNFENKEA